MYKQKVLICALVLLIISAVVNARPQTENFDEISNKDQGWVRRQLTRAGNAANKAGSYMRRQLMRAGEAASRVGSKMGGFAVRLSHAVDRICGIIKKIIPIVGAVCTVGQFQFCALDNVTGGGDFAPSPIAGPGIVDLNVQD